MQHSMGTKWSFIALMMMAVAQPCLSQKNLHELSVVDSIKFKQGKFFKVDDLGSIYLVGESDKLELHHMNGKVYPYLNLKYGNLRNVDPSNPLKVLLHYDEANSVVILDNTLQELAEINLNSLGFVGGNVVISNSKIGGFWLMDPASMALYKISYQGEILSNFQLNFLTTKQVKPIFMLERNGKLVLSTESKKLMVFDINGILEYSLPLDAGNFFQLFDHHIYLQQSGGFYAYNIKLMSENRLILKIESSKEPMLQILGNKVFALRRNKLLIYRK